MFAYRGPADCVLSDGTSLPVFVRLTPEPGLLAGLVGTATSSGFPASYLNAPEVTLQLPDEDVQRFCISNASVTVLELMSTS